MAFKLSDLFGKVRAVEAQKKRETLATYEALVRALADGEGEAPDVTNVIDLLERVGRTSDELAADVELTLRRREWQAQLEQEPALLAEHNRLAANREAVEKSFNDEVERLRRMFSEQLSTIDATMSRINAQRDQAATARNRLIESSGRAAEIAELTMKRAKLLRPLNVGSEIQRKHEQLKIVVLKARRNVSRLTEMGGGTAFDGMPNTARRELKEAQTALRESEAKLRALEQQIASNKQAAAAFSEQERAVESEALTA